MGKTLLSAILVGLSALSLAVGWAWASHVQIETGAPATLAVPQTLQADEIKAHVVRANTIYANKIEADEVHGVIYQSRDVKIGKASGEIKAPEVVASVIYADEIKANSVVADAIYVRTLRRR